MNNMTFVIHTNFRNSMTFSIRLSNPSFRYQKNYEIFRKNFKLNVVSINLKLFPNYDELADHTGCPKNMPIGRRH